MCAEEQVSSGMLCVLDVICACWFGCEWLVQMCVAVVQCATLCRSGVRVRSGRREIHWRQRVKLKT